MLIHGPDDQEVFLKLVDFGLACKYDPKVGVEGIAGTRMYMAPEVLKASEPYNSKCDMWAIGILFYIMVTGCVPFTERDKGKLSLMIQKGDIDEVPLLVVKPSTEALDFLSRFL